MKERLSTALKFNRQGDNNWIKHIATIVAARNRETIRGTGIVRNSVTKHNYMKVLEELYNSTDPTIMFNVANLNSEDLAPWLTKKIWKYEKGSKVLLAREANYKLKKNLFAKRSILGAYDDQRVYKIKSRALKPNKDFFVTPVYSLYSTSGWYYESELIPALFAL